MPPSRSSATCAARSWTDGLAVRVRIGIHSGEPTVTDANYIGMDVHAAARICAAGARRPDRRVERDTAGGAANDSRRPIRYRSLGAHRLRGIPEPMTLFQVGAKGLAAKFPPPRKGVGLRRPRSNVSVRPSIPETP